MNFRIYVFIALTAFVLQSCENPSENLNEHFNLSLAGILTTDAVMNELFVYKTEMFSNPVDTNLFIRDATVNVTDENNNNYAFAYYNEFYLETYMNRTLRCQPGKKYVVNVKTEFGEITGTTEFPGDFEILNYRDGDSVSWVNNEINIELEWTKSENAYGYIITSRLEYKGWRGYIFSHSRTQFALQNKCKIKYEHRDDEYLGLKITISAYDRNYHLHHFDQYDAAGVEGGYGYLGSATVKSLNLKLHL